MFMKMWIKALVLLISGTSTAFSSPIFQPQKAPKHAYTGGWEHYVGGGLAVFDCDDDDRLDLVAAGGESPPSLWRNISAEGGLIRFEALSALDELTATTGIYPIDIDNDRILDLVVLRVGPDVILRGTGSCTFAPMELPGVAFEDKWTTAFSATWEGKNALPTLAFGHYVDRSDPDGPFEACDTNLMLRPDGDSYQPTELSPGFCPLSMLFSDWDRDGKADLRVSNDRHYYVRGGAEQLWNIEETPRLNGEEDGWIAHELWGMGIASRDIDRNGLVDVFLSSMGDQRLQEWTGTAASFKDVPFDRGAAAHKPYTGGDGRPSTGWHISIGDVQNDGLDDVFIAKGNVQQMPGMAMEDPNNLLLQQEDATFVEAGLDAGIASLHRARGAALADFNADGLLDLAVVNRVAPLEIFRNTTTDAGQWLSIEPRQQGANTRAIGGWIELMDDYGLQLREITSGGGHAGGILGPQHFGLDQAETVSFRVIWPDGVHSEWATATPNQRLQVIRSGEALDLVPY
jgi:hypothetical protein